MAVAAFSPPTVSTKESSSFRRSGYPMIARSRKAMPTPA